MNESFASSRGGVKFKLLKPCKAY